nr:MAG TPA: hypothetical protein [Caudoviricetes sp.]
MIYRVSLFSLDFKLIRLLNAVLILCIHRSVPLVLFNVLHIFRVHYPLHAFGKILGHIFVKLVSFVKSADTVKISVFGSGKIIKIYAAVICLMYQSFKLLLGQNLSLFLIFGVGLVYRVYGLILITNKTIDKKSSHNPYTQDYAQFFV